MGFSTLNESQLHKTIKDFYAAQYGGSTEVKSDGHVYDILTDDGAVIEIQTKNLAALLPKILDAIQKKHRVILVHPLVMTKSIELYDTDGRLLSRRKSPKKGTIYDLFDELTGIYPVLLDKSFALEVLEVNITELRLRTDQAVQSKNKRRRFKKNWIKTGKRLDELLETRTFRTAEDYKQLLPPLPETFTARDLKEALLAQAAFPAQAASKAHLILWVLLRMGITEQIAAGGRSKVYRLR